MVRRVFPMKKEKVDPVTSKHTADTEFTCSERTMARTASTEMSLQHGIKETFRLYCEYFKIPSKKKNIVPGIPHVT